MYEEAGNSNLIMLLNTAIYPFLVAAVLTLLLGKVNTKLTTIGSAAGFFVGLFLIHTGLNLPPSKALDFLTVTIALGLLVSFVETTSLSDKAKMTVGVIALVVSFYLLLNPVLRHQGQAISIVWALAVAAITAIVSGLQKLGASERYSHAPALSLIVVAAVTAPVVSIGGSLLIGQLLGVFAASMGGLVLIQRFVWNTSSTSAVTLGSFVLAGLLAQAHVLADLPIWTMLVAYLALIVNIGLGWVLKEDGTVISTIKAIIPQVIVSTAIAGLSLWSVWPESSLY